MNSSTSDNNSRSVGVPLIWGNVPQRNRNFTGRSEILADLRERVTREATALVPHALHGLGGVGKSQLAIEYAHRFSEDYQLVWWVPADQTALVRSTIAALAPRLGITGPPLARVEDAVSAVLDALRRGDPYDRWLLVFDNADQPDQIRGLMPAGRGHVIVTSRDRSWAGVADALEVDVFKRSESIEFLQLRVPGISDSDADRLAEEFGDLPLGLEQASAWLSETAMAPSAYLDLLAQEGTRILSETPVPLDYPVPVAAAWSLSVSKLRTETPDAMELLQCCAFFGAAPIRLELLDRGRYVLDSPLQQTLNDPILFGRATRALGRFALARIDNNRRTLEVHRIIQRLIRDELDDDTKSRLRHEVHMLLQAADRGDPDDVVNWPKYAEILAHAGPSDCVSCESVEVRRLMQDIVRYLYSSGNYNSALRYANEALKQWTDVSGDDDLYVLIMRRLKVQILQSLAQYEEAYALSQSTLSRMLEVLGEEHEETLIMMNCHCIDLWARGEFAESLAFTEATAARHVSFFGSDHPRTFAAQNNYAEDLLLNGQYAKARELNELIYKEKLVFYARDDHPRVLFTLDALGRTKMAEGLYGDAVKIAEAANRGFAGQVREHVLTENHWWVLQQLVDFSIAKRYAGELDEALLIADDAYARYQQAYRGDDHPRTLAAAVNLGNAHRLAGDLGSSVKRLDDTARRYGALFGADHPYALACSLDLAISRRTLGETAEARTALDRAAKGLIGRLGRGHHDSLIVLMNLATSEALAGEYERAVQLGEEAHTALVVLLGENHPHTLACAINLALDLRAAGQEERGAKLGAEAIESFRRTLGNEHPDVHVATDGQRIELGIEVYATF